MLRFLYILILVGLVPKAGLSYYYYYKKLYMCSSTSSLRTCI